MHVLLVVNEKAAAIVGLAYKTFSAKAFKSSQLLSKRYIAEETSQRKIVWESLERRPT